MAYMNQEIKATLSPAIKSVLARYNMKGTISTSPYSITVTLTKGDIDLNITGHEYYDVNTYHIDRHYSGIALRFLRELKNAMNIGNHNNSDIMTDYFDVGWYINICVGKYGKPFQCTKEIA